MSKPQLTFQEARVAALNLWNGKAGLLAGLTRLLGIVLIVAGLLVRFLFEVPFSHPLTWNNIVFFAGTALFGISVILVFGLTYFVRRTTAQAA